MTKRDNKDLSRIVKKVKFNEEDITFYLLYASIFNHYPSMNIQELDMSDEIMILKDALMEVIQYVRDRDKFSKRIMRIVE